MQHLPGPGSGPPPCVVLANANEPVNFLNSLMAAPLSSAPILSNPRSIPQHQRTCDIQFRSPYVVSYLLAQPAAWSKYSSSNHLTPSNAIRYRTDIAFDILPNVHAIEVFKGRSFRSSERPEYPSEYTDPRLRLCICIPLAPFVRLSKGRKRHRPLECCQFVLVGAGPIEMERPSGELIG